MPQFSKRRSDGEKFLEALRGYDIPVISGYELLKEKEAQSGHAMFAPSGTHWNVYAACHVTHAVIDLWMKLLDKPLTQITCDPTTMRPVPSSPDRDIARVANLLYPELTYTPQPIAANKRVVPENVFRPNVLVVGTSFMWSLFQYLDIHHVYSVRNFFYYFKKNYGFKRKAIPMNKKAVDWEKEILKRDIVMIEINEAFVKRIGYGFLKHGVKNLRKLSGGGQRIKS